MNSFRDVFSGFGGVAELAEAIGMVEHIHTVRSWRQRDSIPPAYWSLVVSAAQSKGIEGITLDSLAALRSVAA